MPAKDSKSKRIIDSRAPAGASEMSATGNVLRLNDEQWQAFQELLGRPVEPKPRLAALLTRPGVAG